MENTSQESSSATQLADLVTAADEVTPWLIEGILIEDELGMFHGKEFTGKSYVMLDLALRVARGLPWHGHPTKQAGVLYVPSEGLRGVNRRLSSWMRWHLYQGTLKDSPPFPGGSGMDENGNDLTMGDVLAAVPFHRYDGSLVLKPDDKYSLQTIAALRDAVERLEVGLVIVDVFSDFAPGVDENHRDFGHTLKLLDPTRLGAGVLITHNTKAAKGGNYRGASAIAQVLDYRTEVEAIPNNPDAPSRTIITLTNWKQKNEDKHRPIHLTLERPEPSLMTPMITGPSAAMTAVPGFQNPAEGSRRLEPSEGQWFQEGSRLWAAGEFTPTQVREATGMTKSVESRARNALVDRGLVYQRKDGRRTIVGIVEQRNEG